MSLLKPTPGEVLDRLSIVRLKINAYQRAGRDASQLSCEAHKLEIYLEQFTLRNEAAKLATGLGNCNRNLWQAEDDIRLPNAETDQVAQAAMRIVNLNDLRCSLIRQIDQACGIESIEEKVYGA